MLKGTEMLADRFAVADLPRCERTLLWTMRLWVVGHCRQQDVTARLRAALDDLGAAAAFPFLEGFMWVLSRGASRPLEVLCLCRTEVSDDERLILDAFALLQQGERDEARDRLCEILSDQAATISLRSAEGVADGFAAAGIALPWRSANGARHRTPPRYLLH